MSDDTFTSGDIAAAASEAAAPAEASPAPQTADPSKADAPPTAAPTAVADATKPTGGIPEDRHKDILEKTRREYESKLSRLSWAERMDPERVERALRLADEHERQRLASSTPQPKAPEPDLRTEDGRPLYSAEQAAALVRYEVEQASKALEDRFAQRFGPIEQSYHHGQQAAAIDAQIEEASAWPQFSDHLDAITDVIAQANSRGERVTLEQAYMRVVLPKLASAREETLAAGRKAALAELEQSSAAVRDTVDPSRKPAASAKKDSDKSLTEMLEEEYAARAR